MTKAKAKSKKATALTIAKSLYDDDDICICGHTLGRSHDNANTECEAMINFYVGDCPCMKFQKGY